jgi:hypothetical protein
MHLESSRYKSGGMAEVSLRSACPPRKPSCCPPPAPPPIRARTVVFALLGAAKTLQAGKDGESECMHLGLRRYKTGGMGRVSIHSTCCSPPGRCRTHAPATSCLTSAIRRAEAAVPPSRSPDARALENAFDF